MGAANETAEMYRSILEMLDPGNTGKITVDRTPIICNLISIAAETRTVPDPDIAGAELHLHHQTDGGDITVTFSTAYNEAGATVIVFTDEGQNAYFKSFQTKAGAFFWRKITDWTAANRQPELAEVVTATKTVTAAENGKTFYLNSATEFVTTLPAPFLGASYEFVVAAAPSGASYTVVCAASGTLMKGHVLTSQDAGGNADSGTVGEGTLTFVDGVAVAGDRARLTSDGTNWFVEAGCKTFNAITIS